jgi:cell wall-associated NlpC family hydrolase
VLTRRQRAAAVLLAAGLTAIAPVGLTHATVRPPASSVIGLHKGSSGDNVRAVQDALNRVGIGVKYGVDGYFGSATQASVRAFQRYKHLPITGTIDAATAAALGFTTTTAKPPAAPAAAAAAPAPASGVLGLGLGSRGPAVAQVQQAIIAMGWPLARGADGVFAASTQRALMAIQRANGLIVTGSMNIATARLLGLTQAPAKPAVAPPTTTVTSATTIAAATPVSKPAPAASPRAGQAVTAALSQLGVPYKAFSMSPNVAFDCSGLTAWAWALAGVSLPHQSGLQFASVPHVAIADVQPGDLLFYHSPISHVTMYVGSGMQVQAPRPDSVIQIGPVTWSNVVGVGRPG